MAEREEMPDMPQQGRSKTPPAYRKRFRLLKGQQATHAMPWTRQCIIDFKPMDGLIARRRFHLVFIDCTAIKQG
jgi:hypothetical protein